jgi:hypothetical protein
VEFQIARGELIRVLATSSRSRERGDYDITFSQNLGRPARVLQNAANAMHLPAAKAKAK